MTISRRLLFTYVLVGVVAAVVGAGLALSVCSERPFAFYPRFALTRAADKWAAWRHTAPARLRASTHPMQYYVSRPAGWVAGRSYPVVLVFESSVRDFAGLHRRFVAGRGLRPYLVVTPLVVSNNHYLERWEYPYSEEDWQRVWDDGPARFDQDGVLAVLDDVQRRFGGAPHCFVAGWSAGAHDVWMMVFQHPERVAAAFSACGNYSHRGLLDSVRPAHDPKLPVRGVQGAEDPLRAELDQQWEQAAAAARQRGFTNITHRVLPGMRHGPADEAAFAWFNSLRQSK